MTLDFRSDTVTRPTDLMRQAMSVAQVGDDVYGDDPTVNRLEAVVAERFSMEAGVFVASGTQANLIALMAHCQRGDEYVVGQLAHTYKYEAGGAAVLGSIQPQPLDFTPDGGIDLEAVREVIKPDDDHFANTRLFCLENTQNGRALSMEYLAEASEFARSQGLAFHLDGARVFNAAVFHGIEVSEITRLFDTVACCFSKGLGAPVGSMLCGDTETVSEARRWRKMVGGAMRQAGIIAAGALYAVEHHVDRLTQDHENARWITEKLKSIDEISVETHPMQTNMVFLSEENGLLAGLPDYLREHGIIVNPAVAGRSMRLVTHLDVDRNAARTLVENIQNYVRTHEPVKLAATGTAGIY